MTRIDIAIERLVLTDVPAELAEGLRPLIAQRLGELATADRRGDVAPAWATAPHRPHPIADRAGLAAHIARETWSTTREQVRSGWSP